MTKPQELFLKLEQVFAKEKIEIVNKVLHVSDLDENLLILDNDAFRILKENGILEDFNKICKDLGILWSHSNEE